MKLLLPKKLLKIMSVALLFIGQYAIGQITLPSTSPYSENFNITPGATGTTYPSGWISYNGLSSDATMNIGSSSSTSGANYNYGSKIGIAGSGSSFVPSSIVLSIANTSGKTSLKISYDIVKIREQGRSNGFDLEISTTSATSGFTPVVGGGYVSGTIAENTVTPFTNIDITGLDNSASTVWIRWYYYEVSGSGSRDGIALDNVSLSYNSGPVQPVVITSAASAVTLNGATLNGTINANGQVVDASFEYGTTASYGSTIAATPTSVTGSTATSITASLGSLALNTQYFYRAVGSVSGTPTNGANMTFYTLAATPGVLVVSNPTQNTLDVAVTAATQNSNPAATLYAIQETGGQYVQANGSLGATAVWQTAATWATVTVTGLSSSTLYTFQTKARNGATVPVETIFGATAAGSTTAPAVPVVTAGTTTGTYNVSFSYSITASNTPTSYALSSGTLPLGLSLNTTTGVISGTPTGVGIFNANFTASNAGGTSAPAAITITINKANQTITFAALSAVTYGDASFALTGSTDSSLAISYTSSDTNVATVSGSTVTIVGPGTTTIEATQPGNATYNAAVAVGRTLTVNKKTVTISGLVADNKVQDGTTFATLSGTPTLVGVINSDAVTLGGVPFGNFASAAPGIGIAVTVSGYALSGADSAKYTLTQPTGLTADITAVEAPVATAATAVGVASFTANWDAVADATSYVIDVSTSPTFSATLNTGNAPWINEFHYDNNGGDVGEFVEIVVPNSYVGSNLTVSLYNGNGGVVYGTVLLSAMVVGNSTANQTIYHFDYSGMQNGPDGIALFDDNGLIEFLSYDGTFIATDGPAIGIGSTNIGQVESASTPIGNSLQLSGNGNYAGAFIWQPDGLNTKGALNTGQTLIAPTSASSAFVIGYENLNVGNVTSFQITGLNANTQYYYRVRAVFSGVTSVNSNVIAVTTADDTCVWSSMAWSNVTGPTEEIEATIADAYDTTTYGGMTAKKLTIAPAGSLVINSGTNVFVINEVINNGSTGAAALVVENNANLIQLNNTTNTGNITVNRETSALKRLDYVLWSSPVVGQLLQPFSPATFTNRFYTYNAATNLYASVASPSTTSFSAATGFLIRTPDNHPSIPTIWSSVFTGLPHNGDFSVAVVNDTYNAVGNPYPSTLDADAFMADNSITEALYFWRKENNSANPSYATYTSAGGVANIEGNSALVPSSAIQVGQGFIAKSTSTSLNFTNSMRVADNDNLFLRSSNTVAKSRLWLDLTNTDGLFCQTLIAYMPNATSGVDSGIDGRIFSQPTNGATLTSIIGNDSSYIIQGKGSFFDTDVVPLAFKTAVSGNFTIALSNVDGLFATNAQDVFLKDNLTNTITNLTNGDYTFATAIGDFVNRFEIVYQTTVLNTNVFTSNSIVVYTQANGIVVNAGSDLLANVKVFDIRGRLLVEKANLNDAEVVLNVSKSNEVLLVQVTNQNGDQITQKVIN